MFKRFGKFSFLLIAAILAPMLPQALPAQAQSGFADPAFQKVWERTDAPVLAGTVSRGWMWGPDPGVTTSEPYAEGVGGVRKVQYFDKARMEINDPNADPNSQFYVTNGRLAVELITGRIQIGNSTYQPAAPANIPIAGDGNDADAPTYASFNAVLNIPKQNAVGKKLNQVIDKAGQISADGKYEAVSGSEIAYYDETTGRNIPAVFWNFLNSSGPIQVNGQITNGRLSDPWFYASGLPLTEAYWATVKINGNPTDVLIQPYERRVLTYVPSYSPDQQVLMGNIGRHYYDWRYNGRGRDGGGATPTNPGNPTPTPSPTPVACTTPPSISSTVTPACGPGGTVFTFSVYGFTPNEALSYWFTTPDGLVVGTDFPISTNHPGRLDGLEFQTDESFDLGVWALTFEGATSKHQSITYFEITPQQGSGSAPTPTPTGPQDTSVPASKDGTVNPPSGRPGTRFDITIFGFQPNETVTWWVTDPTQAVYGEEERFTADANGRYQLSLTTSSQIPPGLWSVTFHGVSSKHESIIYFRILQ